MDEKLMYRARLDGNFAIVTRDRFPRAVDFNAHQARLNAKVLGLELMEMEEGALWSVGAVKEFPKVGRDATREIVFVRLAEEKTSSWWRFEEFGGQQATETVVRQRGQAGPCRCRNMQILS